MASNSRILETPLGKTGPWAYGRTIGPTELGWGGKIPESLATIFNLQWK